jgi:hypothetical protein
MVVDEMADVNCTEPSIIYDPSGFANSPAPALYIQAHTQYQQV